MLLDCHSPVYHDVTNVYQLHTKRETLGLSVTTVTLQHQPCWISLTKVAISVKNVYKLAVESIHWGQQTVVHENSSLNKTVYFGHFPNSGQYLLFLLSMLGSIVVLFFYRELWAFFYKCRWSEYGMECKWDDELDTIAMNRYILSLTWLQSEASIWNPRYY